MLTFLARRIVIVFLPTLLGISILVFGAMRLIPGSFVDVMIGIGPDVSEEQRDAIARSYGLDKPLPVQYLLWLGNAATGDFGSSLRTGDSVGGLILDRLPATLELALLATLFSLLLAIPAGILSAVRRNGAIDTVARVTALVVTQETTDYYLLGINCQEAPFDNVKVRQALSLAIDRTAVLDAVFFGEGSVSGPIVPTLGDWATPVDQLPLYQPDTEQAIALLAEAGLADRFEMSITVSPFYPEFVNIALVIQQQLQEVGITVTLDQVEWGTFIDRWSNRDFQTFVSYNSSGNDPDRAIYPVIYTGGSVNAFQFSDPAIDALLDEGRTTVDPAARREVYQQADKAIAEAAPAIFLFTRTAYFALRDTVQGFEPSPVDTWETLKRTAVG